MGIFWKFDYLENWDYKHFCFWCFLFCLYHRIRKSKKWQWVFYTNLEVISGTGCFTIFIYTYIYIYYYYYGLNEEAWYATQSFMLFEQSSGIHFIYLFSKKEKEKLNKIHINTLVKIFYQRNVKAVNLYCPS